MDYLSEHRSILEKAVSGSLPARVDERSEIPVAVIGDLVEEGLLRAINACTMEGMEFLEPKITVAGREYLNHLNDRAFEQSASGKIVRFGGHILHWIGGIIAGILIATVGKWLL